MEKSNKKNYVCIFPGLLNYHLIKDVGLLPYTMGKYFNYNSNILTYNNDDYTYLDDDLKGDYLKLIFLENKFKRETRDVIYYLLRNSRNIDVLQSFVLHDTLGLFVFFSIFKILNRKGKAYVKLDADDYIVSLLVGKKGIYRFMQSFMIKHLIDIMSVESSKSYNTLVETKTIPSEKLLHIPNGIYIPPNIRIQEKKNYILTVGHLGIKTKATEVLLEAFARIKVLDDWKLILVGRVEESFKEYINNFFKTNPHLRDKIIFKGYVSDRDEIYRYYSESKIFCFPSRSESFGIALIESAYFGNYILTTDVGGARDILDVTEYGELIKIDDSQYLADRLQDFILHPEKYEMDPNKLMVMVDNNFNWVNLCKKINKSLDKD
jgi:glycosyltransferase involved in cell wall biosynthesis